jgi:hypothetical protein
VRTLKTESFILRITELQKEKIMYLASLEQMNKSEYIRTLIERIDINEESFNKWKIERNEEAGEGTKDNERS